MGCGDWSELLVSTTSLYWLTYRQSDAVVIVLQHAHSALGARLKASVTGVDDNAFSEGHLLSEEMAAKVPEDMIGRVISMKEAAALLKKMG
jgi:hypothetical protein